MKAAYGAFLSSLVMIKCHDMVADQAATEYNVTWSRTTPIVVSLFDDAYRTVMTLECDHRFGMDVIGDTNNVTAFRYACSSAINPIEHYVMKTLFPNDNGTSIVIGLGKELFNGLMPSIFMSNGYLIFKSATDNMFLIFDPETGILRDVMILNGTISAAYCPSNLQTEWIYNMGDEILFNPSSAAMMNINAITDIVISSGEYLSEFSICLSELSSYMSELVLMGEVGLCVYVPPVAVTLAGIFTACFIFDYCVDQGWLPPERCREICGNAFPFTFGIINLFIYHEPNSLYTLLKAAQNDFRPYVKDNLNKIDKPNNYNVWPPIPGKKPKKDQQIEKDEQEQMEEFIRESSRKNRETLDKGIELKDPKLIAAGLGGFVLTTSIAALYCFEEQLSGMVNDFSTQCQIIYRIILPESNSTNNNTTT